jgi:hypothetical protein
MPTKKIIYWLIYGRQGCTWRLGKYTFTMDYEYYEKSPLFAKVIWFSGATVVVAVATTLIMAAIVAYRWD